MGIIVATGGPLDDAAALVEASAWISESEFARSYYAVMGGDEIRTPRTVTALELHVRGHELARRWKAPTWRESPFAGIVRSVDPARGAP